MYPTEGNLSPYSAECVEGEFCEVHECAQSSLACSSVFTPQCAGGLSSAGSRVFSSPIAGSNSSWVRLALERSAPERTAPERSASRRSAPVRLAPVRFAPMRSALKRFALTGFALSRSALISSASERSALTRCASDRSVLWRFASERFLPERSALERFGSIKRSLSLNEFQVAFVTLMASWITLFWDALLPLLILPTTSVGEAKPSTLCTFTTLMASGLARIYGISPGHHRKDSPNP